VTALHKLIYFIFDTFCLFGLHITAAQQYLYINSRWWKNCILNFCKSNAFLCQHFQNLTCRQHTTPTSLSQQHNTYQLHKKVCVQLPTSADNALATSNHQCHAAAAHGGCHDLSIYISCVLGPQQETRNNSMQWANGTDWRTVERETQPLSFHHWGSLPETQSKYTRVRRQMIAVLNNNTSNVTTDILTMMCSIDWRKCIHWAMLTKAIDPAPHTMQVVPIIMNHTFLCTSLLIN